MSANVPPSGNTGRQTAIRQLDQKPEPEEQVTEEQVQDPTRLVRILMSLLRNVATLTRRWAPVRLDYEDIVVTGTGLVRYRFAHNLKGRVRWWVVDWQGGAAAQMIYDSTSDDNTLVLISLAAGSVTIRVEPAG